MAHGWPAANSLQWGRDQLIAETAIRPALASNPSALQWGRDQLIAETGFRRLMSDGSGWLQWGRDQLIAETWASERVRHLQKGFNGAAIN